MFNLPKKKAAAKKAEGEGDAAVTRRMMHDVEELDLPATTTIEWPNGQEDLQHLRVTIRPDDGLYSGGRFRFSIEIPQEYPHRPPIVRCETKVYHPNIDLEGKVCLNILREDWKPVLTLNAVIYGLQYLFLDPNPRDPLNRDAAEEQINNPREFEANVKRAMGGGSVRGERFDNARA